MISEPGRERDAAQDQRDIEFDAARRPVDLAG
jgi:hypothetical protein